MKYNYSNISHFLKQDECCGCMTCLDACKFNALSYYIDKNGFIAINLNKENCINCKMCVRSCPGINPPQLSNNFSLSSPYGAWNKNLSQREKSSSGGVFIALATTFINEHSGVVYGAAIDGFDIKHIRVDKTEDLWKLQGSKYQHSISKGIYQSVQSDLLAGKKVLFSGLGCQINGLYLFLRKIPTQNLYTIDTICGGLSTLLPMLNLKNTGNYRAIKSFRDKENGWKSIGYQYCLKMFNQEGKEVNLGQDNLVLKSFSSAILKRNSCLNCKFIGLHRKSDCTIGDFWKDEQFKSQHYNGLSVIITHNSRLDFLLKSRNINCQKTKWENIMRGNPNLYCANKKIIRKFISRKLALWSIRHNLPENFIKKLIGYDSLYAIELKVFNRIIDKLNTKAYQFIINQIKEQRN